MTGLRRNVVRFPRGYGHHAPTGDESRPRDCQRVERGYREDLPDSSLKAGMISIKSQSHLFLKFLIQVLLVSGGECLEMTTRVCSYSAGTDTNPIFLFSKHSQENRSLSPSDEYGLGNIFLLNLKE